MSEVSIDYCGGGRSERLECELKLIDINKDG